MTAKIQIRLMRVFLRGNSFNAMYPLLLLNY
jgi:hypothetical protein